MKIALYGGTFDPPHFGHVNVLVSLQEMRHFDLIYVIPAFQNPLKPSKTSPKDRLEMARIAFSSLPFVKVLDVEIEKENCFTIDTVHELMKDPIFHDAERFLIFGGDIGRSLSEWKKTDRLFSLLQGIVTTRNGNDLEGIPSQFLSKIQVEKIPAFDMSSTEIRKRIREGLYVQHLLPEKVLEYVEKHHLYKE